MKKEKLNMELMVLAFIIILLIVHGIGNGIGKLLSLNKNNDNIANKDTEVNTEVLDFKRDKITGEPKIVALRLFRVRKNMDENVKILSEFSDYDEEKIKNILKEKEKIDNYDDDAELSDEELDLATPIIKKGLTMQEAKDLRDKLTDMEIYCLLDVEDDAQ